MQGNLKKHINSEQVKICFNVRNVMNHLDPEVTLMMEMVLVAIKDVLSNVVVQDVDEFLGNLGNGHVRLRIMGVVVVAGRKVKSKLKLEALNVKSKGKSRVEKSRTAKLKSKFDLMLKPI